MVVAHETRPRASAADPTLTLPSRVIAVGVRDHEYDAAALRWLEYEASAGADAVHLVHAYVPCGLDDACRTLGRRVAAQAVQRVRVARPDLLVDGSAVQGLPEDVLHEFTSVVDLLVIGDPAAGPPRRTTWRIQQRAHCPVVAVPRQFRPPGTGPVTLVLPEGAPAEAVSRFATDSAARHAAHLNVIDDLGGQPGERLAEAAAGSLLIVLPHATAALLRQLPPLPCPVAVVPMAARV